MAQMKGNTSDLLYGYIKQRIKKIESDTKENEKKNNTQQSAPNTTQTVYSMPTNSMEIARNAPQAISSYNAQQESKKKREERKAANTVDTSNMTDEQIISKYESIPEYNVLSRTFSSKKSDAYDQKQSMLSAYQNAKRKQISNFMSENGIDDDALGKVFANNRATLNSSVKTFLPIGKTNEYNDLKKIADNSGISMEDLYDFYNAKKSGEFVDNAVNFADEHGVLGTGASFATNLIGTAVTVPTELMNYATGKPIGSNEEINNYGRVTGEMRGAVKENISESIENPVLDSIANFGYDVGTSIGDMATALAVGGQAASLPIMATSAGANTLNEAKDRNLTPDQMMGTAIASGAIEAITEKIPLDNLFKIAKTQGRQSVKQILKNALKQAGTEASEEAVSELANTFVDNVINEDESVFNQSVNQYMIMYGLTRAQAENKAREDIAARTLQSALAGAVSGGIMAGGASLYSRVGRSDVKRIDTAYGLDPLNAVGLNENTSQKNISQIKERANSFLNTVMSNKGDSKLEHNQLQLSDVPDYIVSMVNAASNGKLDISGKKMAIEGSKLYHEINKHSNAEIEASRGQIPLNGSDISNIIDTMYNPDYVEYVSNGLATNQREAFALIKADGGYIVLVENVGGKRNPNIVPEQIIHFTDKKMDRFLNGEVSIADIIYENKTRKGTVESNVEDIKNRVTAAQLAQGASAHTSETSQRSPLFNDSIPNSGENVNEGQKKRSYNETFVEKTDAPQELKNEFINNPDMYTSLSNADTKAKADAILNENSTDSALTKFRQLLDKKRPEAVPLGYSLSKKLYQEGRIDESVQLVRDMSRALTESGQFSQAAAITMLNNDPEAAKRYIIRELDTLNQKGREKYGKKWTDFELSEADLKKFDSIEPGDTDAIKAAYQSIYDRISKQYPSTMTEKLMEFRRISMLLNVRTNVRNVVSNALLYPVRWTADRVSALGEGVYSLIDPKYQRTQSINPIRSQNAKKLASEAFETVKTELLGDNKYEDSKGAIRDRQMFKGSKLSQMLDTVTNGAITKANQAMGKNVNPSLMETARNFTYWLLEKGDNVFVRKNFESRMASYIDAQGITDLESIPSDAYTLATQETLKATFKDDSAFANGMSAFRKMLNQTPGHFIGDAVMPFTKTPANLAMRGFDYSPAGVLNGVKTLTSAKSNADIAKGITQLGQAATGTAAIALGYALAGAGIISGSLSDDKDEAQFQKQQGQLAYAVKTPFGYLTYDWAQPASIPIILGVTIYDSINNDGNFINGLRNGFLASVDSWLELSPLQNISDIFGGYGSSAENVWDVLSTDLPLSYLPAQLGAAARIGDTTQRVTYDQNSYFNNLMNQAKSKIPGLSETLPVAYDTWGNPIKRQDSTAESAFANILNPGQFGNSNVTPIDGEISRLYDATGDAGVFPRKASWSANVGGETIKLDNKQYSEYQRIMGTDAYDMVSSLIESQAYNSMSDEQRAEAISDMYSFSDALAKSEILGYDVENSDTYKKTYSVYKEKGSEGVAVYLGIKQNQEGEKISDKFTAVDSIDLSDEDKGYYLSKIVDVSKAASEIQNSYGDAGLYTWYSLRSNADSDGNGNISNAEMVNQIIKTDMSYDDMLNYASVLYEDGKEKTARKKAEEAIQDAQRLNRIESIINGHKSANSSNYQSNKSSLERIEEIINSRYSSEKVSNDDSLKRIQSIIDNRNARLLTPLN